MQSDGEFIELNCRDKLAYFLRAECHSAMPPFIRVWINDLRSPPIFVPAAPETEFLIRPKSRDGRLFVLREEVVPKEWRPKQVSDVLKLPRLFRFHKYTRFEDRSVNIQPLLHRSKQSLDVARAVRTLAEWGFGTSMRCLQNTLSYEFVNHSAQAGNLFLMNCPSIAVVVHLHYDELWPDFESRLGRLSVPFKLIVTTSGERPALAEQIRAQFPDAKILAYPNRGRDIGPFIQLWRDRHLDGHDLICKVHGKRSLAMGSRAVFGEIWRRSMLNDLLGSDGMVRSIVNRFAAEPSVGLIGPTRFRLPNEYRHSYVDTWARNNEELTKELAVKLGCPKEQFSLDFFAGTMFWIRRELLDLLKPLDLSLDSFPDEKGQTDGALQHALERLFGVLPGLAEPKMKTEETAWPKVDSDEGHCL